MSELQRDQQRQVADRITPRVMPAGIVEADADNPNKKVWVTFDGDPANKVSVYKTNNFDVVVGESCLVLAQGSRMVAVGLISDYTPEFGAVGYRLLQTLKITSTTTFTKASYSGIRAIRVKVIAGGGGGGAAGATVADNYAIGGAGGGGGYSEKWILASTLNSSETVTVGAGGSAGASGTTTAAGTGGTSSFTVLGVVALSAIGGSGGLGDSTSAAPGPGGAGGAGGTASGGDINIEGSRGQTGVSVNSTTGTGIAPIHGGGTVLSPQGSLHIYTGTVSGVAGAVYGQGGGGSARAESQGAAAGAAGGNGVVLIEIYV